MERRHLSQTSVSPEGKSCALSQSHPGDTHSSKSMEDLPTPNISAPTRNPRGLMTSLGTPKAAPHFAPLKTPSPNGILRKREANAGIMTTIHPLSVATKPLKDPSLPSSLQSMQRKAEWNPATVRWKEPPVKVSRCSSQAPRNVFSLGVQLAFHGGASPPTDASPWAWGCPVEA